MVNILNEGYCWYCGEEADDYREIGNIRFYVCEKAECQREADREARDIALEMEERQREEYF